MRTTSTRRADGRHLDRGLRIALVSTTALRTPPSAYGGTELIVAELAEALVDLGHRPTVFATGDSSCAGVLEPTVPTPVWPPDTLTELRHVAQAWSVVAAAPFDVVHVHSAVALPFVRFVARPTVATLHHAYDELLDEHYASYPEVAYAAVSDRQRELSPRVAFRATVHHGLAVDRYPAGSGAGGYCAFLGRFAPEKAPHVAIDAAMRAGAPIRLGGEAHSVNRDYFDREVAPRLSGRGVTWLGEVGGAPKLKLLSDATCVLCPIDWEEPFGIVMIEAMLVGTPIIAFRRGSVPEIVEDGVTGYAVRTVDEMVACIRAIGSFDRKACRRRARERWSSRRMASDYVALYRRTMAAHAPSPAGVDDGVDGLELDEEGGPRGLVSGG